MPPQALTLNKMDKDKTTALTFKEEWEVRCNYIKNNKNVDTNSIYEFFTNHYAQQLKEKDAEIAEIASELESMITKKYDGRK